MSRALLDAINQKILEELRQDGRRSSIEIAKAAGVSDATVRRRIAKLMNSGIGKIQFAFDRIELGYNIEVICSLRIDIDKIESAAMDLAQYSEISYVGIVTGDFDIILHAHFRTNDEVLAFIREKVARIEGIRGSQTLYTMKVVKRSYSWMPMEAPSVPTWPNGRRAREQRATRKGASS
jgi:Lrp/AsnC family transcriptional regulator for asnA, asnC and gidA